MKKLVLLFVIFPILLIGQTDQVLDTISFDDVEWIENYTAHKKGVEQPFTGVVTFEGELDYRRGISWRLIDNGYYSAANFVDGKFNGPYTIWYKKGGQKKSEISLLNYQRAEITLDGPTTEWYENGQLKRKGSNYYGDIHGLNFSWYEDGQMQSKSAFERGKPIGIFTAWHPNGHKAYEATYIDGGAIKKNEWDANGIKINEWPTPDQDGYGLKRFLDEFITILKSRDFNSLQNLFMSKEMFLIYLESRAEFFEDYDFKNSNKYKKFEEINNEQWKEKLVNAYLKRLGIKEILDDDLFFDEYIKNAAIKGIKYDYSILSENKKTIKIKWPETINYDISNNIDVNAEVSILIVSIENQYEMKFSPCYFKGKWYFTPLSI